jgi:hypothetical protein
MGGQGWQMDKKGLVPLRSWKYLNEGVGKVIQCSTSVGAFQDLAGAVAARAKHILNNIKRGVIY